MSAESNLDRAMNAIETAFKNEDLSYSRLEENLAFRIDFESEYGELSCLAQIEPEIELFRWYVFLPGTVAAEARLPVAEYLTRVNFGLPVGNFELDFEDGEVRFKVSMDIEGGELTPTQVNNTIATSLQTVDMYQQGLLAVAGGQLTPEQACLEAEAAFGEGHEDCGDEFEHE